jgi:hypothetical protein
MSFEANKGQTDEKVKFLSRGSGYTLFLTSMARHPAWVFFRRAAWHSGFRQARCRAQIRRSGRNQCRQIEQGFFRAKGMVFHHHPTLVYGLAGFQLRIGGSILESIN